MLKASRSVIFVTAVAVLAACGGDKGKTASSKPTTESAVTASSGPGAASDSSPAAATSDSSPPAAASDSADPAKVSGKIRLASAQQKEVEAALIAAFNKVYPNVKVEATEVGNDAYVTQIRTQLPGGSAPDVFQVFPGAGNAAAVNVLQPGGYLADLSDRPWVASLPPGIKVDSSVDARTYAAITGISGIGAIYNSTALAAAGASAPKTWTEVLALCDTAKAKGKAAYAMGAQDSWTTQMIDYALVATLFKGKHADFAAALASKQASFAASPEWQSAVGKFIEMRDRGCFNKSPLGTNFDASLALVAKGEAYGVVQGNWALSGLKKNNAQAKFTLEPLPATDNPDDTRIAAAGALAYGVNAKSKNKEAALAFIDFVMSGPGQSLLLKQNGGLPTVPIASFEVEPGLAALSTYVAEGKTAPFPDQSWPNPQVQAAHLTGLQKILTKQASANNMLADMDSKYVKK